jgi:hypothetical protein
MDVQNSQTDRAEMDVGYFGHPLASTFPSRPESADFGIRLGQSQPAYGQIMPPDNENSNANRVCDSRPVLAEYVCRAATTNRVWKSTCASGNDDFKFVEVCFILS